ncbi:hypothetical protein Hanom_Chr03g00271931 [Helianthus anomalus]
MYQYIYIYIFNVKGMSCTSRLLDEQLVLKYIKSSTMLIATTFAFFSGTTDT